MKRIIAIVLAVLTVFAFSSVALAEGNTTTLTTTVPDATYTLNIPADQEIAFGATDTAIGNITTSDSSGFAEGKNLQVTMTFDAFRSEDTSTTIPFKIRPYVGVSYSSPLSSGGMLIFNGNTDGTTSEYPYAAYAHDSDDATITSLNVTISSTDWGKALPGEYSSTITFTAEVVSES